MAPFLWLLLLPFNLLSIIYSPPGIRFSWRHKSFLLDPPTTYLLGLALMMRYLALGNRGDDLNVPDEFISRARALGKLDT